MKISGCISIWNKAKQREALRGNVANPAFRERLTGNREQQIKYFGKDSMLPNQLLVYSVSCKP